MLAITRSMLIAALAAFVMAAPAAATQPPVRSGYEYAVAATQHAGASETASSDSPFPWGDLGIAALGVAAVAAVAVAGTRRRRIPEEWS